MRSVEILRPVDVLLACKLHTLQAARVDPTFAVLAAGLGISTSTAHEAAERCRRARLLPPSGWQVVPRALRDLLVVAVPRVFYAVRGELTRGMPTGASAPVLAGCLPESKAADLPLVWYEDDEGEGAVRGEGVEPLYPTVPAACRQDAALYELMALADVARLGSRALAEAAAALIEKRISTRRT